METAKINCYVVVYNITDQRLSAIWEINKQINSCSIFGCNEWQEILDIVKNNIMQYKVLRITEEM